MTAGCTVEEVCLVQGGQERATMYTRIPQGPKGSPACILVFDCQAMPGPTPTFGLCVGWARGVILDTVDRRQSSAHRDVQRELVGGLV